MSQKWCFWKSLWPRGSHTRYFRISWGQQIQGLMKKLPIVSLHTPLLHSSDQNSVDDAFCIGQKLVRSADWTSACKSTHGSLWKLKCFGFASRGKLIFLFAPRGSRRNRLRSGCCFLALSRFGLRELRGRGCLEGTGRRWRACDWQWGSWGWVNCKCYCSSLFGRKKEWMDWQRRWSSSWSSLICLTARDRATHRKSRSWTCSKA